MFVRRKPYASGTYSVQVVMKNRGRYVVVRSFGSSSDESELSRLEQEANRYIRTYGGQTVIDFERPDTEEERAHLFSSIQSIVQNGPHMILDRIYDGIGFGGLGSEMLRDLVVSRVCCPRSKLATTDYLRRYRGREVDINVIYRFMDKLDESFRQRVQQISVEHTRRVLGGKIGIVFYDVTTLYFETAREDSLLMPGFSKDGKTAESQIVLGLLVSMDGYPLAYSIFNGSQYEGRTMIPLIDDFVSRFGLTDFVVVADAGLLSRKNIDLLKAAGYKFILAGRIKKESEPVRDWVFSLTKDSAIFHETVINGDERIIVSYSDARARKDANNRERGIARLRKSYASGKVNKKNINQRGYNKFLVVENDVHVRIDEAKIAEDARWDGLKSYVTNTDLPAKQVIEHYHELWGVERAFRVVKGKLETRPVFHFTERRIEAHICICFMAYKVYKELERLLKTLGIGLSVDKVLDIAKTISTVTVKLSNGKMAEQTMLTTPEQKQLAPLLGIQI